MISSTLLQIIEFFLQTVPQTNISISSHVFCGFTAYLPLPLPINWHTLDTWDPFQSQTRISEPSLPLYINLLLTSSLPLPSLAVPYSPLSFLLFTIRLSPPSFFPSTAMSFPPSLPLPPQKRQISLQPPEGPSPSQQ